MKNIIVILAMLASLGFSEELIVSDPTSSSSKLDFNLGAGYSFFDTWLPSKIHFEGKMGFDDHELIIDYGFSSLSFDLLIDDLGDFTEQRTSLLYGKKSSGWIYGLELYKVSLTIGESLVSTLSSTPGSLDLIEITSLNVALGYRSEFKINENLFFLSDWFRIHVPIARLKMKNDFTKLSNSSSKIEDVESIIKKISKIPTFTFLRVGLSYKF